MKKEEKKEIHSQADNGSGLVSFILAIIGIVLAISTPLSGLVLSIISLVFGFKQNNLSPNKWSRRGIILSLIGTILNLVILIIIVYALKNLPFQGGLT